MARGVHAISVAARLSRTAQSFLGLPEIAMTRCRFGTSVSFIAASLSVACLSSAAHAIASAEMYTSDSYVYGRFAARIQFPAGDGVVSSFFLWKDGSEKTGTFWNELDFEKVGADCSLETNAYYGNPGTVHNKKPSLDSDLCGGFHTYVYEWTPDYIAWIVDGTEVRRETGATAQAYAENAATQGMQIRFNVWPGDKSFGGNFSPTILPVYEYINWVEYSSYADGAFKVEWRDDFTDKNLPDKWLSGSWDSPKNKSTHDPDNINVVHGYAVLALTADDATGVAGAAPADTDDGASVGGGGKGAAGATGVAGAAGAPGAEGAGAAGASGTAGASGAASGGAAGAGSQDNGGDKANGESAGESAGADSTTKESSTKAKSSSSCSLAREGTGTLSAGVWGLLGVLWAMRRERAPRRGPRCRGRSIS